MVQERSGGRSNGQGLKVWVLERYNSRTLNGQLSRFSNEATVQSFRGEYNNRPDAICPIEPELAMSD